MLSSSESVVLRDWYSLLVCCGDVATVGPGRDWEGGGDKRECAGFATRHSSSCEYEKGGEETDLGTEGLESVSVCQALLSQERQ